LKLFNVIAGLVIALLPILPNPIDKNLIWQKRAKASVCKVRAFLPLAKTEISVFAK